MVVYRYYRPSTRRVIYKGYKSRILRRKYIKKIFAVYREKILKF